MKIRAILEAGAAILFGIIFLGLLLPVGGPRSIPSTIVRARVEAAGIKAAIDQYEAAYGAYPTGDAASVLKALLGDNPQKIVFVNIGPRSTNSLGEYVDPWGTPYKIEVGRQSNVCVRSAGPNRKLGDKDDPTWGDNISSPESRPFNHGTAK